MPDRDLTAELRHRHQNRRAATTILIVLLMLFFAFWYAYSYYRASGAGEATPTTGPTCRPFNPKVPTPAVTKVNVYNATSKSGLAARTAADLRERGFLIGTVSNDPLSRKVAVAEVRYGPAGRTRVALVSPLGGRGTTTMADKRKDTSVDLVLGSSFSTLAPSPKSAGLPMCPAPSSRPSGSST
ncbi:LytR C-terminal domain-containing protein [Knoellia locipacati]|uniref:LytR C-terminal domain-containing protein n=1 Tax=Knoellia locipacati TaxID=882824 RepID=UPI0038502B0B